MNQQDQQQRSSAQQSQGSGGQKQQSRSKKSAEKKEPDQQFHLKVVDRVLSWPVVNMAWNEGNHVYGKIKGESLQPFLLSYICN